MNRMIKSIICCILMISASLQAMSQTTIIMRRQGNVYVLPCKVNGLLLEMLFDTGADDVSLSLTEATFMFKNGYLTDDDIVGKQSYRTANGDISEGTKIIIKKISFAGLELKNVEATIMPNMDAPLLLGQSAIQKLGKIQLDPDNNTLTVFKGNGTYDYSRSNKINKAGFSKQDDDQKDVSKNVAASKKATSGTTLNEVLTLKIDRKGGANASSVAWHPGQKKYYAAQAGNATFPMEVFDANGKMLSNDELETMWDVRGLWYNPTTKTLQANGYKGAGCAEYRLDEHGIPISVRKLDMSASQPDAQSVAVYDTKNNAIWFYDMSSVSIVRHNMRDGETDATVQLHLGAKTRDEIKDDQSDVKYNYSENTLVYTGIAKSEIGLLNFKDKQIELYDIATGLMTKVLKLPEDAPVEPLLNFSYCNGIYWLNDRVERVWHGYK